MKSRTFGYLDLASVPAVGATLLSPAPAFVFSADGSRILFANAAGAALFGEAGLTQLLDHQITGLNPLKAQVSRFARQLPSDTPRLEMLRIGQGLTIATLPAACRRLNLAAGARAVLAVATGGAGPKSLTARAETLVDALAGDGRLAAVLTNEGKALSGSGELDELAPVARFIDDLVSDARAASDQRVTRRALQGDGMRLAAGVARFEADGRPLYLLLAETEEADAWSAAVTVEVPPSDEVASSPAEDEAQEAVAAAPEPEEPPAPAVVPETPPTEPPVAEEAAGTEAVEAADVSTPEAEAEVAGEAEAEIGADGEAETVEADEPVAEDIVEEPPEAEAPAPPPEEPPRQRAPHDDAGDLDQAAQESVERGRAPALPPPAHSATQPSNVVHLPPASTPRAVPEPLSGMERDAFRRIAEALGRSEERAGDAVAAPPPPPAPPPTEAPPPESARAPATPEFDPRLLDRVPVGIVIFRDRKTLFANRTLLDLLGYSSLEAFAAVGGSDAIFPGDGLAKSIAEAGGKLTAQRRDGTPIAVKVWLHAVTYAGATALMLSLVESDGSEDEAALTIARLEAKTEELGDILDTATDGVIVTDQRGKIRSVNRSAQALFGVGPQDFVGRYFTDLFAEESQKPALDYLDGLASNGVASVLNDGREVIGRVPKGGLIPLFMTMGRLGASDRFCAVLRDITHWKNVEAELTAARQTAEAANLQKSEFLAKISHEIRTPLNAIIGFSEVMMSERFGPIGNQRYRDYLHDINVSGGHLMSLINDLLDLSKVEAGKLDLAFEEVRVNAAIQECVALMQPQANRERIIIRTSLASDLPNVVADQRSFRQILLNVMSNAVKFTRAGGQVIVSSTLEESGEVTVRIRDTGIGMSEKDIEAALKPFRQVAISAQDREHGTGLGLPLTKALVEANRATFAIESALDQGTLVKITFPTTRVLTG